MVYSVATDHLTGSNVVVNSSGTIEELMDYYPYGEVRLDEKAGSFSEQRKFTGYEYDGDTGLNYAGSRYYEASTGRFISQDPVHLATGDRNAIKSKTGQSLESYLSDPQNFNSYSYARNNPLVYIDETGEFAFLAAVPAIAGAIMSAALLYAPQITSFAQSLTTPLAQIGISQALDDAGKGNYVTSAFGFATAGEIPSAKIIPVFDGLWSKGPLGNGAANAAHHAYEAGTNGVGHAVEFGIDNAKDYVKATRAFITDAINKGFSTKLQSGNKFDILKTYDSGSNTFSVFEVNKSTNAITPRTMFKPEGGINYFNDSRRVSGSSININEYFKK